MKVLGPGVLIFLAGISMANAQSSFQPARPAPLDTAMAFECVPVRASGQDRDRIYKIMITLFLEENYTPKNLTVVHVATSGTMYSRADQYIRSDLRQMPGTAVYYWTGSFIKNPSITMKGTLAMESNGWTYSEDQFTNGKKSYWNYNVCHRGEFE
jgi:hypothetical protein